MLELSELVAAAASGDRFGRRSHFGVESRIEVAARAYLGRNQGQHLTRCCWYVDIRDW